MAETVLVDSQKITHDQKKEQAPKASRRKVSPSASYPLPQSDTSTAVLKNGSDDRKSAPYKVSRRYQGGEPIRSRRPPAHLSGLLGPDIAGQNLFVPASIGQWEMGL